MKEVQMISTDYSLRMRKILDEAWEVFKWQFRNGTFNVEIDNEAGFQFYFASTIKNIGEMRVRSNECFFLEVETKWGAKSGKGSERIDITCGFKEKDKKVYACAIELKFLKTDDAFTSKMFRVYQDVAALDKRVNTCGEEGVSKYSEGRFYLITDCESYRKKNAYKTKTDEFPEFGLVNKTVRYVRYHDDTETQLRQELRLTKEYDVHWDPTDIKSDWYFLEIDITK